MNPGKWTNDSFPVGIVAGFISLVSFYFLLNTVRMGLIHYYENPYLMKPPVVQLFSILFNIIVFRLLIVNFEKEKTGKGFLLITVLLALGYFYFYYRMGIHEN